MITESRFCHSHSAFWSQLLPMSEQYIRTINAATPRFDSQLPGQTAPQARGLVNEIAMHAFLRAVSQSLHDPSKLDVQHVDEAILVATEHISRLRRWSSGPLTPPNSTDIDEALVLATRLSNFFREMPHESLIGLPEFPGCGWLSSCLGDVYLNKTLCEIKAGDRTFRSIDLRQLLCYSALNFAAKKYEIDSVCLINPRAGTYFGDSLNSVCIATSGRSAVEVLCDIIDYVSEPQPLQYPH